MPVMLDLRQLLSKISTGRQWVIKGVDKKTNLAAYFPQSVAVSGERSSEKNNLSKIEKTGGRQRAFGPLALALCFSIFERLFFSELRSDRNR